MNSFLSSLYGDFGLYDDDSEEDGWWSNDPRFEGYRRHEIEQEVTFLRPNYNETTDEFDSEGKDVGWCLSNGFEEVEDGVWSGPWYWRQRGGEAAREKRLAQNQQHRQKTKTQRESLHASCIMRVDEESFARIIRLKEQGNEAFQQGDYDGALRLYGRTHEQHEHFFGGMFLDGLQREEKVKILSNQAECYLRLGQNVRAQMAATDALALDKRHVKSLIRRAKATYKGFVLGGGDRFHPGLTSIDPIAASQAQEDLKKVIRMGGSGVEEARTLDGEINAALESEIEDLRERGLLDSRDM